MTRKNAECHIKRTVRAMAGYTPGEQPKVKGLVKLNTNENPYPPSPRVVKALADMQAARLRLYPDPVSTQLREQIARNHGCRVDQVFASNGSDETLALCTRAFVEDYGSVGYFDPSYSLYPVLTEIRDVEKRPVALGPDFEWRMPMGYRSDLFFLARPNAPTGIAYPKAQVKAFCRRFPGVVVIDEAYVDFADDDCMDLALGLENVLVMRTLSKSYSLAGLRVGYAVGSRGLIAALFKIKDSYNLDAVSQTLALAAVSDRGAMRRACRRIRADRIRLTRALERMGHRVYPSQSNFLWVKPAGLPARDVFALLRSKGILVRYFAGPRTGDFLRITVGTRQECDRLVAVLEEAL